jgi:hypothetical protein
MLRITMFWDWCIIFCAEQNTTYQKFDEFALLEGVHLSEEVYQNCILAQIIAKDIQ